MRVHLKVYGQVQGVLFRHSAKSQADGLGISGWIKNDPDGSVEAVVQGPKDKLEEFVAWCKKGPPMARVDTVEVDWSDQEKDFNDFEVI